MSPPRQARVWVRPPWVLGGVLLVLFAVLLVIAGFAEAEVGIDGDTHEAGPSGQVPDSVQDGGPIINGSADPAVSRSVPAKTMVLTFDDGPDPTWTRQVLSILAKHNVPATFFVVGSRAARHPELIQAIHASGSEIGSHSFTHPDLSDSSPLRLDRELDETQLVLAGSAGISTYLFRPPYSSSASAVDNADYRVIQDAGRHGYVTVLTTLDSGDWQRPGVPAILHNATPTDGSGEILLMHDAGGDRSQTVAALDQLIPTLQQQGYRFTTVTGAAGMPQANASAAPGDLNTGAALLATIHAAMTVVDVLQLILIGVGGLVALRLLLMIVVARREAHRRRDPAWSWGGPVTEPVTVIVPAHDEREDIAATVRSVLASDHPLELIVVDDGSTDGTAEIVERIRSSRLRLIRQPSAGKAAALNTGIAAARYELIVMLDADTVLEPDTVRQLVAPFADPGVGAVAGNVKIAHRDTLVARLQHIEYVIGFGVDRRVQDRLGCITTIPGAAGAYRRRALRSVGGLSGDTMAEDTDLTITVGRAGWRVVYTDRAVAWTEAPATLAQLWRQRYRWSYGTMQAMWKHRAAVRQRGASGRVGRLGLIHAALFHVLLPLCAPLIDVFLVYGLLFLDPAITLLLWSSMMVLQLAGAAYAFRLDREPRSALWVLPLQQVVYRQLMYLVLVRSVASAISGVRVRWRASHRAGGMDAVVAARSNGVALSAGVGYRERWLDVLRVLALGSVVAGPLLGAGWTFLGLGVLSALGGSLLARSLRTAPQLDVLGHRLRRLLPSVWLVVLVLVSVGIWQGAGTDSGDPVITLPSVLMWLFPVADPSNAVDLSDVLRYVHAYLWLLLLTPLLLRAFRRRPVATLLLPLGLLGLDGLTGWPFSGWPTWGPVAVDVATFACCWMIGFAHRDGSLRRLPLPTLLGCSGLAVLAGLALSRMSPAIDSALGQALVALGAVLVLLRVSPRLAWLDRVPPLRWLVGVVAARAWTIFLWSAVAAGAAAPLDDWLGWSDGSAPVWTALALTGLAVLAFGWVEDLGARRRLLVTRVGYRLRHARAARDRAELLAR